MMQNHATALLHMSLNKDLTFIKNLFVLKGYTA